MHLQYLGHPISNDPVYGDSKIWVSISTNALIRRPKYKVFLQGEKMGKGGIDTVPSDERSAPAPPPHLAESHGNAESLTRPAVTQPEPGEGVVESAESQPASAPPVKLLPREIGEDIGMGSPVPLSSEAVGVITRLRKQKVSAVFFFVRSGTRSGLCCVN